MAKKLTDFSIEEIQIMDNFLYRLYEGDLFSKEARVDFSINVSIIPQFLIENGYILNEPCTEIGEKIGDETVFYIQPKGKIICEQGGIIPIYENAKSKRSNSIRANIAIGISILALIVSAIAIFFK